MKGRKPDIRCSFLRMFAVAAKLTWGLENTAKRMKDRFGKDLRKPYWWPAHYHQEMPSVRLKHCILDLTIRHSSALKCAKFNKISIFLLGLQFCDKVFAF